MNLLFVCDEYPPGPHGGIGAVVQTLARTLVQQGHAVWVAGLYDYGYGGKDFEVDEGVQVYRLRKSSEWLGISMRYTFYDKAVRKLLSWSGRLEQETETGLERLRRLVECLTKAHQLQLAEVPDHQHYTRQVRRPVFFPELALPTVARLHGGFVYFAREAGLPVAAAPLAMEQDFLKKVTAISSVSRYTAAKTLDVLQLKRRVFVLPNGVSVGALPDLSAKEENSVIFTGSLLAKKGVFQLMDAWNLIVAHHPAARLHIYGKGETAPLESQLTALARPTVTFHGHRPHPEILKALSGAAIAVLPSFAEAFALAPLEAMAQGVATVYSDRTSGPELIEDGVDGLLADPARPEAIAAAVCSLLQDRALRQRLALKGYEKVRTQFSLSAIAAAHISFYQQVVSGSQQL